MKDSLRVRVLAGASRSTVRVTSLSETRLRCISIPDVAVFHYGRGNRCGPNRTRRIVMGKAIGGAKMTPKSKKSKMDFELLASLVDSLRDAEAKDTFWSGIVAGPNGKGQDGKGTAGSDGYKYRKEVTAAGIPCSSVVRTIEEVRAMNADNKAVLDAYKGEDPAHFTWCLVRNPDPTA